jgi:hypothetical protein
MADTSKTPDNTGGQPEDNRDMSRLLTTSHDFLRAAHSGAVAESDSKSAPREARRRAKSVRRPRGTDLAVSRSQRPPAWTSQGTRERTHT